MPHIEYNESFPCTKTQLWDIMTSLHDYSWRKDIARLQPLENGSFCEYTAEKVVSEINTEKAGAKFEPEVKYEKIFFPTTFHLAEKEKFQRLLLEFDNEKVSGTLELFFSENSGKAALRILGNVTGKRLAMKPFAKTYLVNRLNAYLANLRTAAKTPLPETPDRMTSHEIIAAARAELEKTSLYDEREHLSVIWNMFNGEWREVEGVPQIEVSCGVARIFVYGADRQTVLDRRTTDYREVAFTIIELVLNTAAVKFLRKNEQPKTAAELVSEAFAEIGGEYEEMFRSSK